MEENLGKYKVLGEIFPCDENGKQFETALEVGSTQEVPVVLGNEWVEKGLAEKVEVADVAPVVAEEEVAAE